MGSLTAIEWTHQPGTKGVTWNPIRARHRVTGKLGWFCIHASAGCKRCYAEAMNAWRGNGVPYTAPALKDVEVFLDEDALNAPRGWRAPRTAFVCSMTDLFGEWVPDEIIARVFGVMRGARESTFIVLTKRAARMRAWVNGCGNGGGFGWITHNGAEPKGYRGNGLIVGDVDRWPLPNVRLGVSVEDQPNADARIPELLQTPAAVRFLSVEPLLGPVVVAKWLPIRFNNVELRWERETEVEWVANRKGLDWIIVGGESGPGHREMDLVCLVDVASQAVAGGVPLFVKQDSGPKPGQQGRIPDNIWARKEFPS